MYPSEFRYTKDHEWIQVDGGQGRVGITDYAQKQLGDVVYVELPDKGARFKQGEPFGTIESVKAVSELYCPVSGEVIDVNAKLKDHPETVNTAPHATWLILLKIDDPGEVRSLLDASGYQKLVA